MNQTERLLKALARQPLDRPPAAVPTQNAVAEVMELSGYRWPAAQRKALDMASLAWACHEIAGIESVRVPFDINVEAEAMGCETRFGEDLTTPPMTRMKHRAEYGSIRVPDPLGDGRMPEVLEAIRLLREKAGGEVPVIAALGTPFELLSTTMDFEEITMAFIEEPGFVQEQMQKMTEIAKSYARQIERAGPDVLMLVDGTSQSIGPDYYGRFSFPYTRELVEGIGRPTILHICGNPAPILGAMADTGVSALSIDSPVDVPNALEATGGRVALVGKIAPQTLLAGSPGDVAAEARECLALGLHVIAPGCGIIPQSPLANVRAYVEAVKHWQGAAR